MVGSVYRVTVVYKPTPECPEGEVETFNFESKQSSLVFADRKRNHYSVEKVITK